MVELSWKQPSEWIEADLDLAGENLGLAEVIGNACGRTSAFPQIM
jgi:hypothetical protein